MVTTLPGYYLWLAGSVLGAGVAGLLLALALRHRRHWVAPARRITTLIRDIRAGEAPSEELADIRGGLHGVADEVKSLIQELRQQRQTNAQLSDEIRQRIANRTSALERKLGSLRQQAFRDSLTGLHNRRMLDQFLPQAVRHCLSEERPLAVLMIDVDNFKELNDTLGHAAGDRLLRSLGQIIHSTIRDGDAAFRWGGDEFVIVLPGANAAAARAVAERMQSLTAALAGTFKLSRRPHLSIGACTLADLSDPTPENLLGRADELLYAHKPSRNVPAPV
jgi:diguanylate cyclase (GGDEF)-like protein